MWLALAIESTRYGMSAATIKHYSSLWTQALKNKCRSVTAGEMARLLDDYRAMGVVYPGRSGHIEELMGYLKHTTRLKYRLIDIERVCNLLCEVKTDQARKLWTKLARQGLRHRPDSARLNFHAGLGTVYECDSPRDPRAVVWHLERALTLAEASSRKSDTALLPEIRQSLTMIKEISAAIQER